MSERLDRATVEAYLRNGELTALKSMKRNKWSLFGYWAAQTVHLRRLLGLSHEPSPYRRFSELADTMLKEMGIDEPEPPRQEGR